MSMADNPYESTENRSSSQDQGYVFRARLTPCSPADYVMTIALAVAGGGVLVGITVAVCYGLDLDFPGFLDSLAVLDLLYGLLAVVCGAVVTSLSGIRSVVFFEYGFEVRYVVGPPIFVQWERVRSVRTVSPLENTLTAMFHPRRTCTFATTMRQVIRVDWNGGYLLFPPREYELFLTAVKNKTGISPEDRQADWLTPHADHYQPLYLSLSSRP